MLLSLAEFTVWTGLGPFELALHSFGSVISICLAVLQLDGVISTSWHAIFSPLYVALGLHLYYLTVLSARMAVWGFQPPGFKRTILTIMIVASFAGVAAMFYVEYSTADFLDGSERRANLISSYCTLLVYLLVRISFVYRALISIPS